MKFFLTTKKMWQKQSECMLLKVMQVLKMLEF